MLGKKIVNEVGGGIHGCNTQELASTHIRPGPHDL